MRKKTHLALADRTRSLPGSPALDALPMEHMLAAHPYLRPLDAHADDTLRLAASTPTNHSPPCTRTHVGVVLLERLVRHSLIQKRLRNLKRKATQLSGRPTGSGRNPRVHLLGRRQNIRRNRRLVTLANTPQLIATTHVVTNKPNHL